MIKKAIILACMSVLLFFGMGIRVNAEILFILDNIIVNGDFSNGVNNWLKNTNATWSTDDEILHFIDNVKEDAYFQQSNTPTSIEGHLYYLSFDFVQLSDNTFYVDTPTATNDLFGYNVITNSGHYSGIYERYLYRLGNLLFDNASSTALNTNWKFDNIIFIDLTSIFGYGYEPSLTDFELYYLPKIDYFDTYNSFEPSLYTQLYESDYLDLGEDLTGIDYTKSIIDVNGENIDLDLNAYFYDTYNGSTLISGIYTAIDYVNDNHPIMYYNGETYTLNWAISDYSQRVIYLDLSEEEEEILKRILFNRTINRTQEFFYIKVETGFLGDARFWFSLGSKFDLLVDAKSFLISRKTTTSNDYNVMNEMYIKTYDQNGNVILPALMFNIGQTIKTSYVDDFGSLYTNISRFNFEFELNSPSIESAYDYELLFFYELGIFSSDKVVQPPHVDSDIPYLWDMKVCDFYQIGCHLGNFANETVSTIYTKMKIDEIVGFFDGINESASRVLSIVPDNIGAIIAVILGGVGVAIIVVIIERANK